jgi:hypothetical protein
MSKKREKRIRETNEQYEDQIAKSSALQNFEITETEQLFVLDREGSQSKRKKVIKELLPKEKGTYVSPVEQKLIEKIKKNGKKPKYGEGIVEVRRKKSSFVVSRENLADLWEETSEETSSATSSASAGGIKKKPLRVAFPGQSYHPTMKDHQTILAEAVAIETKLKEASSSGSKSSSSVPAEYLLNNIHLNNQTAKDITSLLLLDSYQNNGKEENDNSDDTDSDSSDDEAEGDDNNQEVDENGEIIKKKLKKTPERKTKAKRNRQKALNIEKSEKSKKQTQKKLDHSIDTLKKILKEIKEDDVSLKDSQEEKSKIKRKKLRQNEKKAITLSERNKLYRSGSAPKGDQEPSDSTELVLVDSDEEENNRLRPYDISSVPLSDELNSSLRMIIPKGIAVKDYMHEMIDNGFMNAKRLKGFKPRDHPYLARKVKWIPKYKIST